MKELLPMNNYGLLVNSSQDVGVFKFECSSYKTLQNKKAKQ